MDEGFTKKVVLPILLIGWFIGLFFLGWKTILWTVIGMALGFIVKELKENRI